jgi:uncharacterized membrane protein
MRSKSSIDVSLTAIFAAIYAVCVVVLGPISFQLFQVRVADALLPLAMLFGWPAIVGLSLGAFVANFFGGLGPIDILGGALANFIATYAAWQLARQRGRPWAFLGIGIEIVAVTLVVGSYLSFLLGISLALGLLGVMLGSIIAIGILGSILFMAFSSGRILVMLRRHGLDLREK